MKPARRAAARRAPCLPPAAEVSSAAGGSACPSAAASGPQMGTLYLVSLPIGDMEDISLRALRILREVTLIAAEDSRVTRKLLDRFAIATELVSFRPHRDCDPLLDLRAHLLSGRDLAFVCDAGTPAIADPGEKLVRVALECGASVRAVPGPVAALAALVLSGLPTGRFAFDGFPPRARTDRYAFFAALAHEPRTLLLYESPAYLNATLRDLVAVLGPNRPVVVAADLTRPGETVFRGHLAAALDHFRNRRHVGEVTLVIGGTEPAPEKDEG